MEAQEIQLLTTFLQLNNRITAICKQCDHLAERRFFIFKMETAYIYSGPVFRLNSLISYILHLKHDKASFAFSDVCNK